MPLKLKRRHGSENWYIRGTFRGQRVDESTGCTLESAAEAVRARREWEIITGVEERKGRAPVTFAAAAASYLEAGGEARFLEPIAKHFRTTKLEDIGQSEVEACAKKFYPKAGPGTINRQVFTPVAAVMRHAAVRGMCAPRVWERPRQPKGRVRWLTPSEAEKLIACSADHLRPLVTLLLYTGARMGEALSLDWRNVDLARAHAVFLDTKNGEDRGVPLHERVVAELANLPGRDGAVFLTPAGLPYPVGTGGGGQIKTAFSGACRRAGIDDFHPHDCRHTWATWHYAKNRDMMGLMKLGGWSSTAMVERYAHVNVGDLAASIALLPSGEVGDRTGTQRAKQKPRAKKSSG